MADFSIPLAGMARSAADFDRAAAQIARSTTTSNQTEPASDSVDLSQSAVDLLQAKNDYGANVKAARVFDDIDRATLDMLHPDRR